MKLYIETENGQTKNHPAFEDNLIQAFGSIPSHWEPFVRVERPALGTYQLLNSDEPTYEKVDGTWSDVWSVREMTEQEKLEKQQKVQTNWESLPDRDNFTAWTFDVDSCTYKPPFPMPEDGKPYFWQGTTSSWVEVPQRPADGKPYKLNFASATWVEIAI